MKCNCRHIIFLTLHNSPSLLLLLAQNQPVKMDVAAVSKECSQIWKCMPPDQRQYWEDMSEREKQGYNEQKAAYQGLTTSYMFPRHAKCDDGQGMLRYVERGESPSLPIFLFPSIVYNFTYSLVYNRAHNISFPNPKRADI